MSSVRAVLQDASHRSSTHPKNSNTLCKLVKSKDFESEFFQCIFHVLKTTKHIGHVDTFVKFLGYFFNDLSLKETVIHESLQNSLIPYLLKGLKVSNKTVRLRSCQILSAYVNNVNEIGEELYLNIKESVLERIKDKDPSVRNHAVTILCRFQDCGTDEENSEILNLLLTLLQNESRFGISNFYSSDMRKHVLANIDITPQSIEYVFKRAKDIDTNVRKAVYEKLAEDYSAVDEYLEDIVDFQSILDLLKTGFLDREESVRKSCTKMAFKVWMSDDQQLFKFIQDLVDIDPNLDNDAFIKSMLCEYFANDERIELLIPNVGDWVNLLQHYILLGQDEESENEVEYIILHLLQVANYLDFSDEAGRRTFIEFLCKLPVETDASMEQLKVSFLLMQNLMVDSDKFINQICVILECVLNSAEQNNADALLICQFKCLEIISILMEINQNTAQNYSAMQLMEIYVFPLVNSERTPEFGEENLPMFISSTKNASVAKMAYQFIFDWILTYGMGDLTPEVKSSILRALLDGLESVNEEVLRYLGIYLNVLVLLLRGSVSFKAMLNLEGSEGNGLTPSKILLQMVEWTDPRNLLDSVVVDCESPHVNLIIEGFQLAVNEGSSFRRAVCHVLPKLYIPKESEKIEFIINSASLLLDVCKGDIVSVRALERYDLCYTYIRFITQLEAIEDSVDKVANDIANMGIR
ncbi:hypothetical protein HDV02_002159 [Globomyces sp. JEL0801]|nr:hypothetical protein HDV02_002159 [Globomyces sp. JEL0801]